MLTSIRQIAKTHHTTASFLRVVHGEFRLIGENVNPTLETESIPLHHLNLGRAEAAFINGDGIDKPRGILLPAKVANAIWVWGQLGYVPTGAPADFATTNTVDIFVTMIYSLAVKYRTNGTFVMNSKTAEAVRKMQDADGRFMWTDGPAVTVPARLMGYPVLICEAMSDVAANAYPIAFGDFNAGYTIAERPDNNWRHSHEIGYIGGAVTNFAAIKLLKIAAS